MENNMSTTATRLTALENAVNDLQTAITNLASMAQLRQLNLIKQEEIEALQQRVADLETQIEVLQTS
jgi:polyhydroxyalkanoate synthesis regulator phasin